MTATVEIMREQRYHLGLRDFNEKNGLPCPVGSLTLGGVTFHRQTEKVTGWGPETRRQRVQGGYVVVSPKQLDAIRVDLDRKLVRFMAHDPATGEVKVYVDDKADPPRSYVRARIMELGTPGFEPKGTDCRLDGWLYMVPQEEPTIYEAADPPSLAMNPLATRPEPEPEKTPRKK